MKEEVDEVMDEARTGVANANANANYHKLYKTIKELKGAKRLKDKTAERIILMVIKGVGLDDIVETLQITKEDAESILARPEVMARMEYKQRVQKVSGNTSQVKIFTPQDAIVFARNALVKVYKNSPAAKDKISALKAIGELSMKEIESRKSLPASANSIENKEKEDLNSLPPSLR